MADREITLWLDELRAQALDDELEQQGTCVEKYMQDYLIDLYTELVPTRNVQKVEEAINWERIQRERQAANRVVTAFHVTEGNAEQYFQTEQQIDMLQAAKLLRAYLRRDANASPLRFAGLFNGEVITAARFHELAGLRMKNTQQVAGAYELDFDRQEFSAVHTDIGWKTYHMEDVSAAAYRAFRASANSLDERWGKLLERLQGKELAAEGQETAFEPEMQMGECGMPDNRNMVKYLREQYPPGTRVRLEEMNDPYAPVTPGTEGEVQMVDDMGTVHCKWQNGSSLGLIPGEDRFTKLAPELTTLKLYMPMTVDYYERNQWGDYADEPIPLTDYEAAGYLDQIQAALLRERHPEEAERGMMEYYGEYDSANQKVRSYVFTAEVRDNRLWGVAECRVQGELNPQELALLKETVAGQASDGLGEGFEQREIKVDGLNLYAHLWQWDNWSIQTEQECFSPKLAEGLPELCFSVLPSSGELICIKKGESGYYPSDWNTDSPAQNRELADYNNERLGVTESQRRAMECGSMHGWSSPGADPSAYEQEPEMEPGSMEMG